MNVLMLTLISFMFIFRNCYSIILFRVTYYRFQRFVIFRIFAFGSSSCTCWVRSHIFLGVDNLMQAISDHMRDSSGCTFPWHNISCVYVDIYRSDCLSFRCHYSVSPSAVRHFYWAIIYFRYYYHRNSAKEFELPLDYWPCFISSFWWAAWYTSSWVCTS